MAAARARVVAQRESSVITKREILDSATKLNLNPHVVEKDYALGWALAGISAHEELAEKLGLQGRDLP